MQLWTKFCRDLESAGQQVLSSGLQTSDTERAEGLRYLTRLLRVGLDMHLEHGDAAFPSFYQASHAYPALTDTALAVSGALCLL